MPRQYRRGKRFTKKKPVTYNMVKKMLDHNIENKQITVPMSSTFSSVSTVWTEADLSSVTQSVAATGRVGRRIRVKSLEIKCVMTGGQSELLTDDPYNVVRVIIGVWKGAAGATPLQTATTTLSAPVRQNLGSRNFLRYKLLDKYIPFQVASTEKGAGDGYVPFPKSFNYYKNFRKGITIVFGDDTVTYPSDRLMIAMLSDSAAAPSPGCITGYAVMTFEDA